MPRLLPRLLLFGGILMLLTFTLLVATGHEGSTALVSSIPKVKNYLPSQLGFATDDGCTGWDPHGSVEQDPPNCLRARQLRQLQTLLVEGEPNFGDAAWSMLYHAERCILGVIKCPERPIILTDYWWFYTFEHSTSGEGIWGDPIIATLKDLNFAPVGVSFFGGREAMWNITRKLSESIHAYWTDDETANQCLIDPRCIRPEDYVPAEDPQYRFNLDKIPEREIGKLPSWRVQVTSFWGARPEAHQGNGGMSGAWYGLPGGPGEPVFSYHTLGNKWHIVPYAYPGHTHIPISIERSCLSSPTTPADERENAIMILAKKTEYFHRWSTSSLQIEMWDKVIPAMKEINQTFWTVAGEETKETPVPEGIVQYGQLTRPAYGKMVSSAKAMLGIGQPAISPSPYTALCRGVPVLIPYWGPLPTDPNDWATYGMAATQHGPSVLLGEPYVYAYNISDPDDMIRQLKKAVSTPIKPFVPEEMRLAFVRKRVAEVVFTDWEGEYNRIVAANDGKSPTYPKIMVEMINKRKVVNNDNRAWALVQ